MIPTQLYHNWALDLGQLVASAILMSISRAERQVIVYIRRLRDAALHIGGYFQLKEILMTSREWLSLDSTDKKSRKCHAHFDYRTGIKAKKAIYQIRKT